MAKYKAKVAPIVEAVRWFKNGDHPKDNSSLVSPDPRSITQFEPFLGEGKVVKYFRHPDISGDNVCSICGKVYDIHGWLDDSDITVVEDGYGVCPGDWVIEESPGEYFSMRDRDFVLTYELVEEPKLYKNRKTGRIYQHLLGGIDTTNKRDGSYVEVYCFLENRNLVFVRESIEFKEKFELLEEIFDDQP